MPPRRRRAAAALLLAPRAAARPRGAGLADHPFAGDAITYLSDGGAEWVAYTRGPPAPPTPAPPPAPLYCSYENGTDLNPAAASSVVPGLATKEACCTVCSVDAGCAAAVWRAANRSCAKKAAADLPRRVPSPGAAVCTVRGRPPPAPPLPPPPPRPPPGALAVPAAVPGDLVTDLQRAGQVGDPLYEMNFLNSSLWEENGWTYATSFDAGPAAAAAELVLVFDGVKMGARVALNGRALGAAGDQFLRYTFPLRASGALRRGRNNLTVTFDESVDCHGRWMACAGGWDWAPHTRTSQRGAATFTKGVWKSVYLVAVATAAISHVVPHTFYRGAYPTAPLADGAHAGFDVVVRVHLWAPAATRGTVRVAGGWGEARSAEVAVPAGDSTQNLTLPAAAAQARLWWPAGAGAQPLYAVTATFAAAGGGAAVSAPRRVGFRHFALVTGDDTAPGYANASAGRGGTATNGMLFRVNGAAVLARGANMIPMEELEGRLDADAHRVLVGSAADAGFNTLRVWGGGVFLPDAWYDACDERGVMVYHDMQYAQRGHAPAATATQEAELRHQVRRLSHHPSIVLWDGCNECKVDMRGPAAIYATFVLRVVADEDRSRSVWPASPADGWGAGVDPLTSRPTGAALIPQYTATLEEHGPYNHGSGWIAVDEGSFDDAMNPVPSAVARAETGVAARNVFASEFGCVVMSSFESMAATLAPEHWALHGGAPDARCPAWPCDGYNAMAERNYDCDPLIRKYFGAAAATAAALNTTGEAAFKRQLYQCMLAQALEIKSSVERKRSSNVFGIIVWQYNEIWPTGGWGSIEYGTPVEGQVLGGRWKPLQYWYMNHLYKDVMCACSASLCVVRNDGIRAFRGEAVVRVVDMWTGAVAELAREPLDMPPGAGASHYFHLNTTGVDTAAQVVTAEVSGAGGARAAHTVVALAAPRAMRLPAANVTAAVRGAPGRDGTYTIDVASDRPALYVVLTTRAQGRFTDNAFLLNRAAAVGFVPFVAADQGPALRASLRVEDLSGNLGPA